MTKSMLRLAVLLAAFAVVIATASTVGSIATAPVNGPVGPPPPDLQAETVSIDRTSGSRLAGWFVPGTPKSGAVLLLQGVRGTRLEMIERARFFQRLGMAVLMIDFQATGESPGKLITFGYLESQDARGAFEYLAQRLPGERIGVVGMSLGGAAAILSDPPIPADAMVLEAVFATFDDAIVNRLRLYLGRFGPVLKPGLAWQLPSRLGIPMSALAPVTSIHRLRMPLLLIAGEADAHATLAEMQQLFARANEPKQLWVIPGAKHVDFHNDHRVIYEPRVSAFLQPLLRSL
jgi:uncharacterized protein